MTAAEIRQTFLDFFKSKGHEIVPSAPIVIKNDPTLMFTNAGMNQFKDIFLGEAPAKYARVADTQRCLRVSGKHNDLEEVGIDTYHHTMFEMLGNWSFGDYFKKEAIAWSWELLTEVYKIDKDRLYVTVFEGDEKEGLPKDQEAYDYWKQYIAEDRILMGNKKDNFWEMGETGPCGPCSEIHYDSRDEADRKKVDGKTLVNADDPLVIEIWNNVFMQFNRIWGGAKGGQYELQVMCESYSGTDLKKYRSDILPLFTSLVPLPAKHVDTGMGFERLVRVLQGKTSNYDTDIFQPLIQFIAQETKFDSTYKTVYGQVLQLDVSMRVMADHIRAISFAISDGQLPSSNKAGYVIRRILRRAVRYAYTFLNFKEPFLNKLVPLLAEQFKNVFPELNQQREFIQKVVLEEEASFLRTLGKGLEILKDQVNYLDQIQDFLDNHYGLSWHNVGVFQVDNENTNLVVLNLSRHISDIIPSPLIGGGFNFTELHNRIRRVGNYDEAFDILKDYTSTLRGDICFLLYDTYGFPADLTELILREVKYKFDNNGFEASMNLQKSRSRAATAIDTGDWVILKDDESVEFTGYDETESIAHVVKYRKVTAKGKEQYQIVLDRTPFYAESGGQVGDTGQLVFPDGEVVQVTDTKKENGLTVHFVDHLPSHKALEDALTAIVDPDKRNNTNSNHSATHLLHAALKQVLGSHVNQKGSLVNAEYLRFDFSHFAKVTDEELGKIEAIVNEKIRENIPLKEERMVAYKEALTRGVNALFGEKYGEYVRVITFDDNFSKELCGGTHVKATGQISYFKIITESAVAAGVRRIEAITGVAAENYINEQSKLIHQLKELLKNSKDIGKGVESLIEENARLKKEIERSVLEKSSGLKNELAAKAQSINGINFIAEKVALPNADAVKNLAYQLKDIVSDMFLVLAADFDGKPNLTVMISENLVKDKGLNAGNIVRELAKEIQGGGGGQPFFATAGGKDSSGLDRALEKAKGFAQ